MKTFLQNPYFDDFDQNKKFYQILFRPSFPVQARELTQIQTILQNQIRCMGDHMFKEGSKVLDGEIVMDTNVHYVRLKPNTNVNLEKLIGKVLTGFSTGVDAIVKGYSPKEGSDPDTIFIQYVSEGKTTNSNSWVPNEQIYQDVYIEDSTKAIGNGSIATIKRGVYYIKGRFALVDDQYLVLNKYDNVPSYRVGLDVQETIITPEIDSSLLDNAIGYYNYAAPGAHRYTIELKLAKKTLSEKVDPGSFIELGQIQAGRIVKQVTTSTYSELEKTLARRTYDESGDYTVRPFKISVREHRNNDRGQWVGGLFYHSGDIVRNYGNCYVATTSGTDVVGQGPTVKKGTERIGEVIWQFVEKPTFNNGVYPAVGQLTKIDIIDGGSGYLQPPSVKISSSDNMGSGATATAVIADGKVVNIIIDNPGSGYSHKPLTITFDGGHGSADVNRCSNPCAITSSTAVAIGYTNAGNPDMLAVGVEGGKAYVQGFEIEKVGINWIPVNKSRGQSAQAAAKNVFLTPKIGNYFKVTNIKGVPPIGEVNNKVNLYSVVKSGGKDPDSKYIIGSCRVRGIEWDSGVAHSSIAGVYRLFVYDIDLVDKSTNLARTVKSFGNGNFSCDIDPILIKLTGSLAASDNKTITGKGTSFGTELKVGDYIFSNDKMIKVETINGQNSITTSENVTLTDTAFSLATTAVFEPQNIASIFPLPHSFVFATDFGQIDYYSTEVLQAIGTSNKTGGVDIQFTTNSGNALFASTSETDNYILYDPDGNICQFVEGSAEDSASRSLNLVVPGGKPGNYKLVATVRKTGTNAGLGKKVIKTKSILLNEKQEVQSEIIKLGVVDCFRLESIKMFKTKQFGEVVDTSAIEDINVDDITDRFLLNDGQTESYYGESFLQLKQSYSAPTNPIEITFTYFDREVVGDYYSVQSYSSAVDYKDIPSFGGLCLSDALDFRPDLIEGKPPSRNIMIKRGTEIELSYQYYLGRKDKLTVDYLGNFCEIEGINSDNPQSPETPNLSMAIANIELAPYTLDASSDSVNVELVDNKRYTMRDIGKLEDRIARLEHYTTLSLLEQQTESLTIQDPDGYDRFKQGFIVDNFTTTKLLTTLDDTLSCSVDPENHVCRPSFTKRHVSLFEYSPAGSDIKSTRNANNYKLYGKVFTLPLDDVEPHVVVAEQNLASRIENINPFAVVSFVGSMTINPSSDDWFETNYLPDVVNNVEGNYLAVKNSGIEGTVWNDWQTTWSGVPYVTNVSSSSSSRTERGDKTSRRNRHNNNWRTDITTTVTTTTTAQQHGQTRKGVVTTVNATTEYEQVGDNLVSTTVIPYMRSRWLLIRAKGLKPYTRYYPKFDGVDVDYWCVPASKIVIDSQAQFDGTTGAGNDAGNKARIINTTKNSYWAEPTDRTCLDVGDVIVGEESKKTAVVIGQTKEMAPTTTGRSIVNALYVVNIKNSDGTPVPGNEYSDNSASSPGSSFQVGEQISASGSISGSHARVVSAQGNMNHIHDPLETNSNGELYFMFWIPDNDKINYQESKNSEAAFQFRCGERVFSLHQQASESSDTQAVYSAVGIINNRQKTINAVRNAVITTSSVTDNRTITTTNTSSTSKEMMKVRYVDPIAQTFLIGETVNGGCFLSKVDIYFATKPKGESQLPVTLQIRTVENGIPTNKVLPFGSVTLRADQVDVSEKKIDYIDINGETVSTGMYDVPTTFEFESPVYVEDTSEYAIVLLSDSTDYNVWIAQLGDVVPGTKNLISKQPHTGSLLKSQNASTWTPVQNQDLKFTLYRANFKISEHQESRPKRDSGKIIGNLRFACQPAHREQLGHNPIETFKDKSLVRIWHPNHGILPGMKIKLEQDDINAVDASKYLTGTVSVAAGDTEVLGTGTRFTYELRDGARPDTIYDQNDRLIGTIRKINSAHSLILTEPAKVAVEDSKFNIQGTTNQINGIDLATLTSSTWVVKSATKDSYVIDVGVVATASGYGGGDNLYGYPTINYDVIECNMTSQSFGETSIKYSLQTVTGTSAGDSTQNEYNGSINSNDMINVASNDNMYMPEPMGVYSEYNRDKITKSPSIILNVTFASDNNCLSPIIDSDRISAILINNIINNPTQDTINNGQLDTIQLVDQGKWKYVGQLTSATIEQAGSALTDLVVEVSEPDGLPVASGGRVAKIEPVIANGKLVDVNIIDNGLGYVRAPTINVCKPGTHNNVEGVKVVGSVIINSISVTNDNTEGYNNFKQAAIGKYIEITDSSQPQSQQPTSNMVGLINDILVTEKSITICTNNSWIESTPAEDGTISIRTAYVDEISPVGGSCVSKYITKPVSLNGSCSYLQIMFAGSVPKMSDVDVYYKIYQNGGAKQYKDITWTKIDPDQMIPKVEIGSNQFTDITYTAEDLPSFDVVVVKVVFKSASSASVPQIRDLRIIGCA